MWNWEWILWIKEQRVSNFLHKCDTEPDAADDYMGMIIGLSELLCLKILRVENSVGLLISGSANVACGFHDTSKIMFSLLHL